MSDVPDDMNFEAFLELEGRNQELRNEMKAVAGRFTAFLADKGVMFDADEFMALSGTGYDEIDAIKLRGQAAANTIHVLSLANIKMMTELTSRAGNNLPADYKKRLQASEVAKGSTQPWLDLIDSEFPGEPLRDEEDLEVLLQEILVADDLTMQSETELSIAALELEAFLTSIRHTELTQDEMMFLQTLEFDLSSINEENRVRRLPTIREMAQEQAIRLGLDMGIWGKVIEHFFGN